MTAMVWYGAAGWVVGWLCAKRTPWSVFLVLGAVLVSIASVAAHHLDAEGFESVITFWVVGQLAWFLSKLIADRRREDRRAES